MPPSTPPRRKAPYLTRDQRLQIRTLRAVGKSYAEIQAFIGCTYRQVQLACEAEQNTPKKRRGRPPSLSQAQTNELIEYITQSRETRQMSY